MNSTMRPVSDQEYLQKMMDACQMTEIENGHRAMFFGKVGVFQSSEGPSEWTKEMAQKMAMFSWALDKREKEERKYLEQQ